MKCLNTLWMRAYLIPTYIFGSLLGLQNLLSMQPHSARCMRAAALLDGDASPAQCVWAGVLGTHGPNTCATAVQSACYHVSSTFPSSALPCSLCGSVILPCMFSPARSTMQLIMWQPDTVGLPLYILLYIFPPLVLCLTLLMMRLDGRSTTSSSDLAAG